MVFYKYKIDVEYLEEVKKANGLTWFRLSKMLGIKYGSLAKYVKQGYTVKRIDAKKINDFLEVRKLIICHK